MKHPWSGQLLVVGTVATLSLGVSGCAAQRKVQKARMTPTEQGGGPLEVTRRALEGSWTLVALSVADAGGILQPAKASGRLTYDAFGTMKIRAVIEDPRLQKALALNYDGRIVIDTARLEFRAADLIADRPVDPAQIAPVSPDKVRRYELMGDSFVVTYVDASARPTAVARWQRALR